MRAPPPTAGELPASLRWPATSAGATTSSGPLEPRRHQRSELEITRPPEERPGCS